MSECKFCSMTPTIEDWGYIMRKEPKWFYRLEDLFGGVE